MSSTLSDPPPLFKSRHFLAFNKPAGAHWDEFMSDRVKGWEPLHRIDQATSGVLLFAEAEQVVELRKQLFQTPFGIKKSYLAGATNELLESRLNTDIRGYTAQRYKGSKKVRFHLDDYELRHLNNIRESHHRVKKAEKMENCPFEGHLYEVHLISGLRHQIRSYFAFEEAPLVGDELYGAPQAKRLELHSWKLSFSCPFEEVEINIEAPF